MHACVRVCVCVCMYIQVIYKKKIVRFQKLTRNLFLRLHGRNTRATVLVSHALPAVRFACLLRVAGPVSKMASQQEKAFCVLRLEVSRSVITMQREFRARFRKDEPCRNNITRWYRQFCENWMLV